MGEGTKRFLKNGASLALAAILMRTVSVSFGAYVSGAVGPEGMGLYSLIMSVYTLAVTFATSGVQLATVRLVSEALGRGKEGEARAALRTALGYALAFGAVASAVLFLGAPFFGTRLLGDTRTVPALRLLSLALLPVALSSVFSGYFTAVRRPTRAAAVSMGEQMLRIMLTVLLLGALLPRGMTYACLALVGGSALAEIASAITLGLLYLLDRRRPRGGKGAPSPVRALFGITLPIAASSYVRSGLLSTEHMLIPRALERGKTPREEALSAYGTLSGMALPLALWPMAILSAFAGLLVPEIAERAARKEEGENRRICERSLTLALAFGLLSGGILAAYAAPLSRAVYGTGAVAVYLALLAPILPVMYLDHVTDVMLKGLGRQVYAMAVNIFDSLLSILLVLLLLPRLGALGYVLVIALAEIFNFSLSILGLSAALPFRFPFLRAVLLPMAAILPSVTLARRLLPPTTTLTLVLSAALSVLLSLALLAALWLLFEKKVSKKRKTTSASLDKGVGFGYNKREVH